MMLRSGEGGGVAGWRDEGGMRETCRRVTSFQQPLFLRNLQMKGLDWSTSVQLTMIYQIYLMIHRSRAAHVLKTGFHVFSMNIIDYHFIT